MLALLQEIWRMGQARFNAGNGSLLPPAESQALIKILEDLQAVPD